MAMTAKADDQTAAQAEAPEKDSPLLDLSDAAVKKFIKTAKARGFVTLDALNAVLPSEEVSPDQIEDTMAMLSDMPRRPRRRSPPPAARLRRRRASPP
jgi:RNA polymerase primary sigma factor